MKRLSIILCFAVCCSPAFGQVEKKALSAANKALAAKPTFSPGVQYTLSRRVYQASNLHSQVTRLLSQHVEPSIFLDLKNPSKKVLLEAAPIYEHYQEVMDLFAQYKKNVGPALYYHTQPTEWHALSPAEKHALLQQTLPLYHQLHGLKQEIETDEALENALALTDISLQWLDPSLRLILQQRELEAREAIRTREFYLYPTENTKLPDPSIQLEGKRIVIINDNISILRFLERDIRLGILFPQAEVTTQGDANHFLNFIDYSAPMPDIIFTDIQLADGGTGSGYYLAYMLRKRGYKGGIIALTSYEEDDITAKKLASQGFDGFISLRAATLTKAPIAVRLTQAAQIYLQKQAQNENK